MEQQPEWTDRPVRTTSHEVFWFGTRMLIFGWVFGSLLGHYALDVWMLLSLLAIPYLLRAKRLDREARQRERVDQ